VLERHPRIELLVNNAGHKGPPKFLDADPATVESVVNTNFLGSVWCLNAFLPGLRTGSHVVNMVSVAGTVAYGPYSAAKHAQLAFSRSVAVELTDRGVSVHTIVPGFVETPGFPQEGRFPSPLHHLVATPALIVKRTLRAGDRGAALVCPSLVGAGALPRPPRTGDGARRPMSRRRRGGRGSGRSRSARRARR
jgi:NAD(P)-dependent dehydrogenase (short-subunit alcohol dehydrogenase family)